VSNSRRHRRSINASRTARRQDITDALVASRLVGCRCDPDLDHRHANGIARITVAHELWCPAVDHASQLVIRPRRP
jgi:hypothetical protein